MKVFAYVYCVVDDKCHTKHESVMEIYETAKAAIDAAKSRGYSEDERKKSAYDELCIWMSKPKPYENTEGGGLVYITTYKLLKS